MRASEELLAFEALNLLDDTSKGSKECFLFVCGTGVVSAGDVGLATGGGGDERRESDDISLRILGGIGT